MNTHPLITELQKLKESSRYAIAQGGKYDLDDFKKYLHIERKVESRLKEIIVQSSGLDKAQLILVCGNVGDGKSHILSYLHGVIPNEMSRYIIHNDATESHNPNETSNETLYRVLDGFKDDNIETYSGKIILAINLGTLSKFIEVYSSEFEKLTAFVQEQSILDNANISTNSTDSIDYFRQINFTDYHLYELTAEGPISATISELLDKVVSPTDSNIIYRAYNNIKSQPEFMRCPVKYNYEFLSNINNRKLLVQLIIQSIAQYKEIVSVRSLLNFIHDLIVPTKLSITNESDQVNPIQELTQTELVECLIPNYIFEHADLSNIFSRLSELDPCHIRNSEVDDKLLKLQSTDYPSELFAEDIQTEKQTSIYRFLNIDRIDRNVISKYYIRLLFFQNRGLKENNVFHEYMTWLFHVNNSNPSYLTKLYDLIEKAIKKWYGDPKKGDKVILKLGRRQTKYRVFKDFSLTPIPPQVHESKKAILHQFIEEFVVRYASLNPDKEYTQITIDFSLFKTLQMIKNGYRPNRKDNNNFIYFVYFIDEVTKGTQNNVLYIDEVNIGKPIDYKLTKNLFGRYKFEVES